MIEQLGEPLRSHSVIRRLSGKCDSAIYDGNRLLLFTGDNAEDTLLLNNDAVLWHNGGKPSELFPGMRGYEIVLSGADKKDTEILSSVFDDVVFGQSLWHAMQRSVTFSPLDYGVVKIGEETGRMPYALHFLADYYARKENQKRMLVSALSYPAITLCIALAVLTFMLAVVAPMFQSVYERMGGELPVMDCVICLAVNALLRLAHQKVLSDQVLSARLPADKLRHPDVEVIGNDRDRHRVLSL